MFESYHSNTDIFENINIDAQWLIYTQTNILTHTKTHTNIRMGLHNIFFYISQDWFIIVKANVKVRKMADKNVGRWQSKIIQN